MLSYFEVFGIRRSEHTTDVRDHQWPVFTGLCSRQRILFKVAEHWMAVLQCSPESLADVPSRMRLRSFTSDQLIVPSCNLTTVGRRAFPVSASKSHLSTVAHDFPAASWDYSLLALLSDLIISQFELTVCCGRSSNYVILATLRISSMLKTKVTVPARSTFNVNGIIWRRSNKSTAAATQLWNEANKRKNAAIGTALHQKIWLVPLHSLVVI